jgi:hypothetical protein
VTYRFRSYKRRWYNTPEQVLLILDPKFMCFAYEQCVARNKIQRPGIFAGSIVSSREFDANQSGNLLGELCVTNCFVRLQIIDTIVHDRCVRASRRFNYHLVCRAHCDLYKRVNSWEMNIPERALVPAGQASNENSADEQSAIAARKRRMRLRFRKALSNPTLRDRITVAAGEPATMALADIEAESSMGRGGQAGRREDRD